MKKTNNYFEQTFAYNLIYIFRINDDIHKGALKVGLSSVKFSEPASEIGVNHSYLNEAAKKRIDQYTKTAGITYELLHTELAVDKNNMAFRDSDVHRVLLNSGIKKKILNNSANEWFITDLNTAKNAITAVKKGKKSLFGNEISTNKSPVILRPNQRDAVDRTKKQFKNNDRMLWNAKMRFGKTLSALQLIKELNFKKTIIMTHRPVVDDGWFEDFEKIFYDTSSYKYGSKSQNHGDSIEQLEKEKVNYVYFASIQDLRGSAVVGGKFDKNNIVFSIDWDLVIVDEAHEGTGTSLGEEVISKILKPNNNKKTKLLELSGTPFNLLGKYDENQIYTWDYVMEQREKMKWYIENYGDPNPYEDLPKMNIFTYNLDKELSGFNDVEDMAFNFREFFRVWTDNPTIDRRVMPKNAKIGEFVHKEDVKHFLDLLCRDDLDSNYPYSKPEYREYFRHSLWMIPGVKEAKALSKMLHEHPVFGSGAFNIVNVAGEGDDYEERHYQDAKKMVEDAIGEEPENTYTITLSCGRLTTGVSIKAWTAIFMLSGSASVSAQNYLQTIFRAQTPAKIGGKVKDSCYVFDFAPDRTLNMVSQASELSTHQGAVDPDGRDRMGEFLNFCPVIGISGSTMETYSVDTMLQQLKKAHADRVVRNGFDDPKLYNDNLLKLDEIEIKDFNELKDIIGSTKAQVKLDKIEINNQGMTDEDWEVIEEAKKKKKNELTQDQLEALEKLKEARKQQRKAIDILRGISIRIPMLIYGADIEFEKDVTIDNFLEIVDDNSWNEFMPNGVTKSKFKQFSKYYDVDVFLAAGRKIRNVAKSADKLTPTERVQKIANLFATFKNPDKETVLTPWRVVNLHVSKSLGGWCFYNESYDELNGKLSEPRFISHPMITLDTLATNSAKILEINSKSGLYPLYLTYSIYRQRCLNCDYKKLDERKEKELWRETISNNIFVVCKTRMASTITKRTLNGYEDANFNVITYEDIINKIQNYSDSLSDELKNPKTWGKEGQYMKFNAIVGNPPYQENIENRGEQPPVYHYFYDLAMKTSNKVSLITPARFLFDVGKTPSSWNNKMLNDAHFKVVSYYPNSKDVFDTVDIKGGVAITYWDKKQDFGSIGTFSPNTTITSIVKKVRKNSNSYLSEIIYSNTSYKYTNLFYSENEGFDTRVSGGSKRYMSSSCFDKFPEAFHNEMPINERKYVKIIGRKNNKREILYFDEKYLNPPDNFKYYKVLLASSNGSGQMGEALSTPIVAEPNVGATETFVSFGKFDSKEEALNFLKYTKTKFARIMLGTKKVTQGNKNSKVWENVPLLDYKNNLEINWSLSISEIDKQLYRKFKLSNEEIEFIESTAVPMD